MNYLKNLLVIFLVGITVPTGGLIVLVWGGEKMAPFVAVGVTTIMVLFFYNNYKKTMK